MKKKIFVGILIISGIILVLYPFISNYIKSNMQTSSIVAYKDKVESVSDKQIEDEMEKANEYNEKIEKDSYIDVSLEERINTNTTNYLNLLNVGEVIGYIYIPKIEVRLPIYHGISRDVLQSGVGNLESSSLPVGGLGTHAVLAGHTGLAKTKIFDDIDKLEIGDRFYIYILNNILEYEVDNIDIVEPSNSEAIKINPDKDYITLVTCTPKYVNTHRLLVRGSRVDNLVENEEKNKVETLTKVDKVINAKKSFVDKNVLIELLIIVIVILIFILIKNQLLGVIFGKKGKEEGKQEKFYKELKDFYEDGKGKKLKEVKDNEKTKNI